MELKPAETSRSRFSASVLAWTWLAVFASVAACLAIIGLQAHQEETMRRYRRLLTDLREARVDLTLGYLHLSLSSDRLSPFSREQGLALLDQSIEALREVQGQITPVVTTQAKNRELVSEFQAKTGAFREQLAAYSGAEPAALYDREVALRLSFHELERLAQRMDDAGQGALQALSSRLHAQVAATLAVSATLLSLVCLGVYRVGRRKQAAVRALHANQARLQASEARFKALFDQAAVGVAEIETETGRFLHVNRRYCESAGYSREELLGLSHQALMHPDDLAEYQAQMERFKAGTVREFATEMRCRRKDGEVLWVAVTVAPLWAPDDQPARHVAVVQDITARKRGEHEGETMTRLLELLNAPSDLHALMRGVAALLRERLGCQAVGIRLREDSDFPYYETSGFPEEFVQLERQLCQHDASGQPVLDDEGNPSLACMCGNVLCGRFSPNKPFFTARGSFWSNDTSRLLASTTPADRQADTRNRCNGAGYESVGLFALRTGSVTYGLLQINDQRRGLFTPERLALLERMADSLAIGLAQRLGAARYETLAQQRQLALDAAQMGWWSYDPATRVAAFDGGYRKIFGVSGSALPNDEILSRCIHPDDLPALWPKVEAALDPLRPQPYAAEYRIRRGDGGQVRWIRAYGIATFEGEGAARRAVSLVGTVEDITERKQAEERLRESEERYRTLVETTFDWVWEVDDEGRYTTVSPKIRELLGYAPEEVLGRTPFDLMPEAEARRVGAIFREIASRREPFSALENVNRHKDGRLVTFETSGVPTVDAGGRFKGYRGMDRDITARKNAEAALRRSEAHLRTLVNTLPDLVWLKDPQGVYLACNARFEMLFAAAAADNGAGGSVHRPAPEDRGELVRALHDERRADALG